MRVLVVLALLAGCREVPALPDARVRDDAAIDAPLDKARACAVVFGSSLTNSFGRLDGTVRAVVPPGHPTCPMPNGTHLVVQVMMAGQAYRMVTNVLSDSGDPRVFLHELDAPLAGPAWAEGWHPGYQLDYATTLHVASDVFVPHDMTTTVDMVTDRIELGAKVSVFATSSGGANASGAHLVHRNTTNADGAIVIGPDTASPHWILFRFDEQTF
jgi:hypothetical protein